MTKVIQFNQEEQACKKCELIHSYFDDIVESKSPNELFTLLSDLVDKSLEFFGDELFQDGYDVDYKFGFKSSLEQDIELKQGKINDIEKDLDKEVAFVRIII